MNAVYTGPLTPLDGSIKKRLQVLLLASGGALVACLDAWDHWKPSAVLLPFRL